MFRDSHVFYHRHPDADRYYYNIPAAYHSYHKGPPSRFFTNRRNMNSSQSRKYGTHGKGHNHRYNGRNYWERQRRPRRNYTPNTYPDNYARASTPGPQCGPSSRMSYAPSNGSISGSSDSGSKRYKPLSRSPQEQDQWYGSTQQENQSLKKELNKKTQEITDLRAKFDLLVTSTEKQMLSKHHKLTTAKNEVEKLKQQVNTLKEQLKKVENNAEDQARNLTEQNEELAECKDKYEQQVEQLTRQLGVSKQLIAQKDKYMKDVNLHNWNNHLTQKNCELTRNSLILEQRCEAAWQKIQLLNKETLQLQADKERLQKTNNELLRTAKERKMDIVRFRSRMTGWPIAINKTSSRASEGDSDPNEKEECKEAEENNLGSPPKLIPDKFVPSFILDKSNLSIEERTIKPKLSKRNVAERRGRQMKSLYPVLPNIPCTSVLRQIFEPGGNLFGPELLKNYNELPSEAKKSFEHLPEEMDNDEQQSESEDKEPSEKVVEPWQLSDPEEIISRTDMNVRVYENFQTSDDCGTGEGTESKD